MRFGFSQLHSGLGWINFSKIYFFSRFYDPRNNNKNDIPMGISAAADYFAKNAKGLKFSIKEYNFILLFNIVRT